MTTPTPTPTPTMTMEDQTVEGQMIRGNITLVAAQTMAGQTAPKTQPEDCQTTHHGDMFHQRQGSLWRRLLKDPCESFAADATMAKGSGTVGTASTLPPTMKHHKSQACLQAMPNLWPP